MSKKCRHNNTTEYNHDSRECLDCGVIIKVRNLSNNLKNNIRRNRRDNEWEKNYLFDMKV